VKVKCPKNPESPLSNALTSPLIFQRELCQFFGPKLRQMGLVNAWELKCFFY
jgi:hypothetical protein